MHFIPLRNIFQGILSQKQASSLKKGLLRDPF